MPRLYVLSGDDLGAVHEIADGARIGRGRDVDVTVHGASVSRQHARLERRGETWYVVDLGSSNGTRVGGVRVGEAALADGEEFLLGDVEVRFRIATGTPAPAAASPPPAARAPAPAHAAASVPVVPVEPAEDEPVEDEPAGAVQPDVGIELEGDWSEPPVPARPATPPAPRKSRAPAGTSAPTAPTAPEQETRLLPGVTARRAAETARRRAAAAGSIAGTRRTTSGGRVLQYHRVEDTGGLLTAEVSQQPTVVRWLLYLLAIAVFAALAWGAFQLAAGARRGMAPPAVEEEG